MRTTKIRVHHTYRTSFGVINKINSISYRRDELYAAQVMQFYVRFIYSTCDANCFRLFVICTAFNACTRYAGLQNGADNSTYFLILCSIEKANFVDTTLLAGTFVRGKRKWKIIPWEASQRMSENSVPTG